MSLSNFFKYTGGPTPRLYIFSSNSQATIIESPNEITQLAFLTVGKSNNSVSFMASYSNISVVDRAGPMFTVGRQPGSSNGSPRVSTSGSYQATEGYRVGEKQIVTRDAEFFTSNVFVDGFTRTSNILLNSYAIRSTSNLLQFGAPSGFGHEIAFQYGDQSVLRIGEQSATSRRLFVGSSNSNVEVFTVNGRARIDRGLHVSRPLGSNTLLLSDPTAPESTIGPRMVVFREYIQGEASTFSGIGFDGASIVHTAASADQTHKFQVMTDRTREVLRVGADSFGAPRIGIGFSADSDPTVPLHLRGDALFEGDLFVSGKLEGPSNIPFLDDSGRIQFTHMPTRVPLLNEQNKVDDQYLPVANCNLNLYRTSLNVGIGTNLPRQKLHVAGNTYIENGRLGIGEQNPAYPIHVFENTSTNALYYSLSAAGGDHLLCEDLLPDNSASNTAFVITHTGRVGIKTRPDNGFDLHVNGRFKANEFIVNTISLTTLMASNIDAGNFSTGLLLNNRPGSTRLNGYTVSTEELGVVDLTAYPSPASNFIFVKSRVWMTREAPFSALSTPNELTTPIPLNRNDVYGTLSNIGGYKIQSGLSQKISLLAPELSNAIPASVQFEPITGTTGYQPHALWPYVFAGFRELIKGQVEQDAALLAASNANVALQARVTALEQQVAQLLAAAASNP